MVMLNDLDRFHLVMDVIDRVPGLAARYAWLRQEMSDARIRARAYTREHGDDPPEVREWTWLGSAPAPTGRAASDTSSDFDLTPTGPA
jgi:xylulose-5-phosphate/fructose-6-phosphate phosphoketolase